MVGVRASDVQINVAHVWHTDVAVQAHKQNGRVLLECQSGILVFFAGTPQNMYARGLHVNGTGRELTSRVSVSLLASGCQHRSLDHRRHGT